jgi:hypothetical protein
MEGSAWDAVLAPLQAHGHHVTPVSLPIDSGHWPMFTRPVEVADMLSGIADG